MGMVKNDYIECNERGYGHSDKVLCHDCIGNSALKSYIKANGHMTTCHYCGKRRLGMTMEEFMPAVMSGIYYLYDRAVNQLPCDSGEYVGKTYSTEEIIFENLYDEIDADDECILADIVSLIDDEVWCDAEPFADTAEDTAFYNWQAFCKMVKEKVRFVFYQAGMNLDAQNNPAAILDTIANYTEMVKLTKRVDRNIKLYRCRTHETNNWFGKVSDFAPPPVEYAASGRMNAEGINVLYLTLDPETALQETSVCGRGYATIVSLRVKDSVSVLDLTKIKSMKLPSVFDVENRNKRSPIMFLRKFAESISQQSTIKGIDYVPTQIVTEYFRYVQTANKGGYAGILYDSVQNPGGKCLVLFLTREEFLKEKYGLHIIPNATIYYQKIFELAPKEVTRNAKAKLLIDSLSNKTLEEIKGELQHSNIDTEHAVSRTLSTIGSTKVNDI